MNAMSAVTTGWIVIADFSAKAFTASVAAKSDRTLPHPATQPLRGTMTSAYAKMAAGQAILTFLFDSKKDALTVKTISAPKVKSSSPSILAGTKTIKLANSRTPERRLKPILDVDPVRPVRHANVIGRAVELRAAVRAVGSTQNEHASRRGSGRRARQLRVVRKLRVLRGDDERRRDRGRRRNRRLEREGRNATRDGHIEIGACVYLTRFPFVCPILLNAKTSEGRAGREQEAHQSE